MKKEKFYVYRIKDLQTKKYFQKEYWQIDINRNKSLLDICQYRYIANSWTPERYLNFTDNGVLFKTKLGAERKVSSFNGNTIHDRKTEVGRILNCKFNFIVVKTKIKYEDTE